MSKMEESARTKYHIPSSTRQPRASDKVSFLSCRRWTEWMKTNLLLCWTEPQVQNRRRDSKYILRRFGIQLKVFPSFPIYLLAVTVIIVGGPFVLETQSLVVGSTKMKLPYKRYHLNLNDVFFYPCWNVLNADARRILKKNVRGFRLQDGEGKPGGKYDLKTMGSNWCKLKGRSDYHRLPTSIARWSTVESWECLKPEEV